MPEELDAEFTDAFWRTLAWDETTWLGHHVGRPAGDLLAYQELLARVRPDWVVETRTGDGGRALYLASIFDLLGHGQVVSIDAEPRPDRPEHPRVTYLTGRPWDDAVVRQVRELVGEPPRALVILGARASRQHVVREFETYAPLVPVGSYVVIEDTIVNGHPVWASHGAGPGEAVSSIVNARGDFVSDAAMEKHAPTFNPGGFLRRVT
jgi:cephalosporin hydroxylase